MEIWDFALHTANTIVCGEGRLDGIEKTIIILPGDNLISIHFLICSETAIPEQLMKLELVSKTFQNLLLEH